MGSVNEGYVTAKKNGKEITIHVETEQEYTLRFINVQVNAASVMGLKMNGQDSIFRLQGTQDLVVSV